MQGLEAGSVPREVSYIGQVAGDTLTTAGFDTKTLGHLWNRQPIDGSKLDDPDMLLRKIPSIGGGAPLVIMEAIRIMKISLEKNQKNTYDLFLSEFANGNFGTKIFVSTDVKELIISRESVSRSILRYKLTLNGAPQ